MSVTRRTGRLLVSGLALLGMAGLIGTATPAVANTGVGGSVSCLSGNNVEGIWVSASSGTSSWAKMSVPGNTNSAVSWSYTLTSGNSYFIHVGCGGNPNNWAVNTYSGTRTGNSSGLICYDTPVDGDPYYGQCR